MENKPKRYGLLYDVPDPSHLVFGASGLPMDIIQSDGNWEPYLPVREAQRNNGLESYACVVFSLLNSVEILVKKKYNLDRNYSEAFLAAILNTVKNEGSSPQQACEFLRTIGTVPEEVYPFERFADQPTTLTPELYKIAKEFTDEFFFQHEFVPPTHEHISAALQCSPLMISVFAWVLNDKGLYYRPQGVTDVHATTMFYERQGEFRRVFDSYDSPFIKDYDWNSIPAIIKRFHIEKKTEKVTHEDATDIGSVILLWIKRLLAKIFIW